MTDLRKAAEMALEALEMHVLGFDGVRKMELAIEALEQALAQPDETETLKRCLFQMQEAAKALAQPEQESVALNKNMTLGCPAYLHELAKPEQEPVGHAVIAGVLFDFMGWLTSRQERIVLSSCDDASPAVKVIEEFAKMRGLSLDDAKVKDWQDTTAPPKRKWVGLTEGELIDIKDCNRGFWTNAAKIEQLLKEKNT
jgi:hypothetical protein